MRTLELASTLFCDATAATPAAMKNVLREDMI
jgi:hypothetical protein